MSLFTVIFTYYLLPVCQVLILNSIMSNIGRLVMWNWNRNVFDVVVVVAPQITSPRTQSQTIFCSFQQLLCINLSKWTYYKKKAQKHSSTLHAWKKDFAQRQKIMKLDTLHHSHSHHIQSLCLLKQLAHHNRRFKTVYATPKMMTFCWNIIFL